MRKRYRLSGMDIQFINQLRGFEEPVYEVVNGRKQYRPLLSYEEVEKLKEFREEELKHCTKDIDWVLGVGASEYQVDLEEFDVTVSYKHRKKGYVIEHQVR